MDRNKAGYSLGEILAVVLVLSIAASVAIPNLSASDANKLELAAQEFAQAIRFARSEALRTGQPHGFDLPSAGRRIRVFEPDVATSPWTLKFDVLHPISKKPYEVDLETTRIARAETLIHDRAYRGTCNARGSVYFDAQGVPRCVNPDNVLLDRFRVQFELAGHTRTLTLDRVTGRVSVQ